MSEQAQVILPGEASKVYTRAFYEELEKRAKPETVETSGPNGEVVISDFLVFRGKLTDVFASLKIGSKYYPIIRRVLLENGCVEYLQRGTRAYDSVLVLRHPPPDDFTIAPLTGGLEPATMGELESRVSALEDWRETTTGGLNIGEALRNMEKRIAQLEKLSQKRET